MSAFERQARREQGRRRARELERSARLHARLAGCVCQRPRLSWLKADVVYLEHETKQCPALDSLPMTELGRFGVRAVVHLAGEPA